MSAPARQDPVRWHLPLLLAVAAGYEWLFLRHGISLIDEGWPLYAAMRLQAGGTLYRDVFFVFPPGHLLPAWIGQALDPPGLAVSRVLYAGFAVAACAALYFLGRRLMPPSFALLGALLLAVAAPQAHIAHNLFGYRYAVWGLLALLAFARRIETGERRWMLAAGLATGVALCFRLTPAFASGCGVAVGILGAGRSWPERARDAAAYGLGILLAAGPVVAWLASGVGLDTLWREVVVRPVVMTERQSLPLPELTWPAELARRDLKQAFIALEFRAYPLLFAGYGAALLARWAAAAARRRPFDGALLLAVVVWGAVTFFRTLGRSDVDHLESALPPVCLLLAHAASTAARLAAARIALGPGARRAAVAALSAAALFAWVFLHGTDRWLSPEVRGREPIRTAGSATHMDNAAWAKSLDVRVRVLRRETEPGDTILDLAFSPLVYVLAGRLGPGYHDVLMPGSFLDEAEEIAFVRRLDADPPAMVFWPVQQEFDRMPERALRRQAPHLANWIFGRYELLDPPVLSLARLKRLKR